MNFTTPVVLINYRLPFLFPLPKFYCSNHFASHCHYFTVSVKFSHSVHHFFTFLHQLIRFFNFHFTTHFWLSVLYVPFKTDLSGREMNRYSLTYSTFLSHVLIDSPSSFSTSFHHTHVTHLKKGWRGRTPFFYSPLYFLHIFTCMQYRLSFGCFMISLKD